MAEIYKQRHAAIWPELKELLHQTGISDYSIFFDPETNILFAVQQVRGTTGSQDLAENPVVQRWWAYMSDIMETNEDQSPVTTALHEVFHMD